MSCCGITLYGFSSNRESMALLRSKVSIIRQAVTHSVEEIKEVICVIDKSYLWNGYRLCS